MRQDDFVEIYDAVKSHINIVRNNSCLSMKKTVS